MFAGNNGGNDSRKSKDVNSVVSGTESFYYVDEYSDGDENAKDDNHSAGFWL